MERTKEDMKKTKKEEEEEGEEEEEEYIETVLNETDSCK